MDATVECYALNALAIGVIVTGCDARIVYANAAADVLLHPGASGLGRRGDKVFATDSRMRAELHAAIARACDEDDVDACRYILAAPEAEDDISLAICVLPLSQPAHAASKRAMLVVQPIHRDCDLELEARRLFGLSRSEARIASAVASGLSLQEAAEKHNVTLSTVRSHMKRIYSKTGVSRQSQVAALLRGAHIPIQARSTINARSSGSQPGLASQIHPRD